MAAKGEDDPDAERGPLRRCIATRDVRPKAEMVRFVVGPDDSVVPDVDERLPGRGLWLTADGAIVRAASAKRLFARAVRGPAHAADDLAQTVEGLLVRRCQRLLGLARRAGQVVAGFEKVRAELRQRGAGLVLQARDAGSDAAKIAALAQDVPVVRVMDGAELGAALGRSRVVHVAVAPGRLAGEIGAGCARLAGFRKEGPEEHEK